MAAARALWVSSATRRRGSCFSEVRLLAGTRAYGDGNVRTPKSGVRLMLRRDAVLAVAATLLVSASSMARGQEAPQPAASAEGLTPQYLVGPGDSLQIFVWDHPDLTVDVQVRPDGR